MKKPNKYRNRKITMDGISFDSVQEYNRWCELQLFERAGKIQKLQRQIKYILIPTQYGFERDKKTGRKKRVCWERKTEYVADFVYLENDKLIVEDCKGFRTKEYIIKRKLMLQNYGIRIRETGKEEKR